MQQAFQFLNYFIDFFFFPLKSFEVTNVVFVLIYAIIITLAIVQMVKGVLSIWF